MTDERRATVKIDADIKPSDDHPFDKMFDWLIDAISDEDVMVSRRDFGTKLRVLVAKNGARICLKAGDSISKDKHGRLIVRTVSPSAIIFE